MDPTDGELVAAMAAGDRAALERLYRRHAAWIGGRLARSSSSRDLVEEALQDAFLAAWRSAHTFGGRGEVTAWLWGIARRRLISLGRKRTDIPPELLSPGAPGVDEVVLGRVDAALVRAAMERLPEEQRSAIEAVVFAERPVVEAAAQLGIPVGTLKSRLHRARLRIRAEIEAT
jgi:RNA polymerase sigma-70 factor, ECF subfamily